MSIVIYNKLNIKHLKFTLIQETP